MITRRFQILLLAAALVLLGPAENGIAKTWLVSKEATSPLTTIQRALDLAQEGDSILVAPGNYNEDIDFAGKDIVLKSEGGPEVTTIDGAGQDSSIVTYHNNESRMAILEGFTLANGVASIPIGAESGGAIFCTNGSPTIRSCTFRCNTAIFGGAIAVQLFRDNPTSRPHPKVDNCIFERNSSLPGNGGAINVSGFVGNVELIGNSYLENTGGSDGGAIATYMNSGSIEIRNSVFKSNTAQDQGGGVFAFAFSTEQLQIVIDHNVFEANAAFERDTPMGSGGAMTIWGFNGSLDHNTFVRNTSLPATPCGGGAVRLADTSILEVHDNVFYQNHDCGLVCRFNADARFGPNLFWDNPPVNLLTGTGECKASWLEKIIVADPQFCASGSNPYSLASSSPAFAATGPMGAFPTPGCTGTPVISTTWGGIKAMFR